MLFIPNLPENIFHYLIQATQPLLVYVCRYYYEAPYRVLISCSQLNYLLVIQILLLIRKGEIIEIEVAYCQQQEYSDSGFVINFCILWGSNYCRSCHRKPCINIRCWPYVNRCLWSGN